jgi:hypothetical protein
VRERNTRNSRDHDGVALWARPLIWSGGMLLSRPRDSMLTIAAAVAAGAIVINSLYLQPGPHPAPIFALKRSPIAADTPVGAITERMPAPRPAEVARPEPVSQPRVVTAPPVPTPTPRTKDPIAELLASPQPASGRMANVAPAVPVPPAPIPQAAPAGNQLTAVQRRLSEFGYGPVPTNGVDGPDTRAAIERFERSRGLPVTGKVSDKLVRELTSMAGRPL